MTLCSVACFKLTIAALQDRVLSLESETVALQQNLAMKTTADIKAS